MRVVFPLMLSALNVFYCYLKIVNCLSKKMFTSEQLNACFILYNLLNFFSILCIFVLNVVL